MALAAEVLRQQIAAVIAGTPSTTPGLPTGFAALDAVLPGGGIPAGRMTELLAPPGSGKTTIARSLAAQTMTVGGCVAWIDATRTLDPRDWATAAAGEALWVVRPADPARAPWCADLLLRTGSFALVVLDGAPLLPRAIAVRLAQLARDADAALLLLGDGTRAAEIGGALRLVLKRPDRSPRIPGSRAIGEAQSPHSRPVIATIEKGAPYQHVQLEVPGGFPHGSARRLCAHPEIPDRRGVARSRRDHGAPPRGRRVAQPEYPATR